jgi:hypothetical protein
VALDFVLSPSDKSSPTPSTQKKKCQILLQLPFFRSKSKEKKNMHKKNKNIKEDSQDSRVINYNIPATNPMRKLLQKKRN